MTTADSKTPETDMKVPELPRLTRDVDCPWCKAKAGERCWAHGTRGGGYQTNEIHLGRNSSLRKEPTK